MVEQKKAIDHTVLTGPSICTVCGAYLTAVEIAGVPYLKTESEFVRR